MKVERTGAGFAGRITGLDIAAGVSAEELAQVERFLAEYPVLCFPNQPLTDEQQTAFVHSFGPGFEATYGEVARAENNNPRLIDVANVEMDGTFTTRPEFVYAHKRQPMDLLMWDGSCTMHRATPYAGAEPRMLRWTGVMEREPLPIDT